MEGTFFPVSELNRVKIPLPLAANCEACGLYKACRSPKMKVRGKGEKGIMIVRDFPTKEEDERHKRNVDQAGIMIRNELHELGVDLERDCWSTSALICHPYADRAKYKSKAIEYCRPNLIEAIKRLKPKVVVLLGEYAIRSVIGYSWKENVGLSNRWFGFKIPSQTFNTWLCPNEDPVYLINQEKPMRDFFFRKYLKEAIQLKGGPYERVPDYQQQVNVLFDLSRAAAILRKMARGSRPVAFDYETNCMKPDNPAGKIVCCSASDGRDTICYPWKGEAIDATAKLLKSDVKKIASNMKFEDRWTRAKLGFKVNNWFHDTMLAAHVIDNRPMISSIKFQSFVHLGQESYDDHVKPYLKSKESGGYELNRIDQVDMRDLMIYCGLDSLLEWKVAKIQRKQLGYGVKNESD